MNDREAVRTIDTGEPPARFARGWHCLGLADTLPGRRPARRRGVRHEAGGLRRLGRRTARARRVLPAHGRRPEHGHGQGRRGGLPVPRLALGRRRPVHPGPLRAPGAARGPGPGPGLTLEENRQLFVWNDPQGAPPPAGDHHPAHRGRVLRRVEQLDLGLGPHRRRELPRGGRQRGGHGALLLHPLRLPDLLQERARGPRRHPVPGDPGPAGRRRRLGLLRERRHHAALGGLLLRAVLHDRLPVARLPRHRRSSPC